MMKFEAEDVEYAKRVDIAKDKYGGTWKQCDKYESSSEMLRDINKNISDVTVTIARLMATFKDLNERLKKLETEVKPNEQ